MDKWRIRFAVTDPSQWEIFSEAFGNEEGLVDDVSLIGTGYTKPEVEVGEVIFTDEPTQTRVQALQDMIEQHLGVRGTLTRNPDIETHEYPPPSDDYVANLRDQEHILEALHAASSRWPEVAALAFESDDLEFYTTRIAELLDIDDVQAEAVADIQLRRMNAAGRALVKARLAEMRSELREIQRPQTE